MDGVEAVERPLDLRLPLIGSAAWLGALGGALLPVLGWLLPVLFASCGLGLAARRGRTVRSAVAVLLVLSAAATAAAVRVEQVADSPLRDLAGRRSAVSVELVVTSDPRLTTGKYAEFVVFRARVEVLGDRGASMSLSAPVLVVAEPTWSEVRLGQRLRAEGRLGPPDGADLAAMVRVRGSPVVVSAPRLWWRAADRVRDSIRAAAVGVPAESRPLVPALVVGDDEGLDPAIVDDFRITGLTHLLAVSGTNLTLLLGFVLILARWAGVRGRWLYLVGGLGIVGFVLLARPEPSVLRAAVMGAVALVGMGSGGRRRGARSLGAAVTLLLLVDPWLARTPGFALSALATAGIVFLAPVWRDALATWLPRWLAEALAVPAAAQLACTPVVAGLSGQVSLVAVPANLLAAPAVGPATVLGLAGGLVGLVWPPLGQVPGSLAGWCVRWIVWVARRGAGLPAPAFAWGTGGWALAALTLVCLVLAGLTPRVLRRPVTSVACSGLMLMVVLALPFAPGRLPDDWIMVACDVGQGDALALNAGHGAAVVVDAGPDPAAVDRCLRRLGVRRIPLLVLTHFHADHVDGLPGAIHDRVVESVEATPLTDPPEGVATVAAALQGRDLEATGSTYAETRLVGAVRLQVLWPAPTLPRTGPGDGSTANNASVVLLAEVRGVRLLLAGDIEPESQAVVARSWPGLTVDVLKVPHHGSRYQDLDFLLSLRPRVALVSVGADNDYGHPAEQTLVPLRAAGARVLRTDQDGDLVVIERDGALLTWTSR